MSRSGYIDDCYDPLELGRWRGRVASAIRGKRGQQLLRDALAALDAMPDKRLVKNFLIFDGYGDPYSDAVIVGADELADSFGNPMPQGGVCLLGAVGRHRNIDMSNLDPEDSESVAGAFDIADPLAREIVFMNDEAGLFRESPEARWQRMRDWVVAHIKP